MAKERPQEDIKITFPNCGCVVTFFWRSGWNTARMNACPAHSARKMALVRDSIMDAARKEKAHILASFKQTPQTAFIDLMIAAMMDAATEGKGTQLQTAITPVEGQEPKVVRVIVVSETTEEPDKDGVVKLTDMAAKGHVVQYKTGPIRAALYADKPAHTWPINAPLGTDPTTLN